MYRMKGELICNYECVNSRERIRLFEDMCNVDISRLEGISEKNLQEKERTGRKKTAASFLRLWQGYA